VIEFNPRISTPEGITAIGGKLSTKTLKEAYSKGIFPWPQEGLPILWFSPDQRGVLDFKDFHISESLKKFTHKNSDLKFTSDEAFSEVIELCRRQIRPGQESTWITPEMKSAYTEFHKDGFAHSMECWRDNQLVGGIYGVEVNGVFSGESMFFKVPNASKLCFWKLVEKLKSQGHTWMDIQMVTPVTKAFGGKYISREEYLNRLGI
jgi:leucyl/phenylalanyl-tRNA---protein transferase